MTIYKKIVLKIGEWHNLPINKERPYLELSHAVCLSEIDIGKDIQLIVECHENKDVKAVHRIMNNLYRQNETNANFDSVIDLVNVKNVKIKLEPNSLKNSVELYYITQKLFDYENPFILFKEHLENSLNAKTILSSPFGQGKTTFLNSFFIKHREKYNVFKLFPVNYSVATNEDIFKYIKADLLFQLLGRDIELEKYDLSYLEASQELSLVNPKKSLLGFLKTVAKLGEVSDKLKIVIDSVRTLDNKITEYQEKHSKDDDAKSKKYIEELYEKEGSIFEDNFFTQLIRQLLEQLKQNTGRENVLIIDDLDRMDPDHIFRILNVISAHYDSINYGLSDEEEQNKFGLDKIILVCDTENIRSIFHHKYGQNTNFEGYFNKYFSTKPFEFINKDMMKVLVNKYCISYKKILSGNDLFFLRLINSFIDCDALSLREILKITLHPYNTDLTFNNNSLRELLFKSKFVQTFNFILGLWDYPTLLAKLNTLSSNPIDTFYPNDYRDLLIPLSEKIENKEKTLKFKDNSGRTRQYACMEREIENVDKLEFHKFLDPADEMVLTQQHYCELLKLNCQKLIELKVK